MSEQERHIRAKIADRYAESLYQDEAEWLIAEIDRLRGVEVPQRFEPFDQVVHRHEQRYGK